MRKISIEQQWEYMGMIGKSKYIWVNWVFRFGLGTAIISQCIHFLLDGIKSPVEVIKDLVIEIVVFMVFGYIFGILSWSGIENKMIMKEKDKENMKGDIDFCYFCGGKMDKDSKICPACGKEIES